MTALPDGRFEGRRDAPARPLYRGLGRMGSPQRTTCCVYGRAFTGWRELVPPLHRRRARRWLAVNFFQPEGADHAIQLLCLLLEGFGRRGALLDERGVLLRHLIELVHRGVDLAQP